jgi:hypothetical protein
MLDLVAIAAAIAFFHDVPGFRKVGDDAVGAAFCDAECGGDVPQTHTRIMSDT